MESITLSGKVTLLSRRLLHALVLLQETNYQNNMYKVPHIESSARAANATLAVVYRLAVTIVVYFLRYCWKRNNCPSSVPLASGGGVEEDPGEKRRVKADPRRLRFGGQQRNMKEKRK